MPRVRVVLLVAVTLHLPMLGQTAKSELFGGYSLERIAGGCGTDYRCGTNSPGATTNLNGWIASLTSNFYRSLGVTAQLSGNYGHSGVANGGGGLSTVQRYAFLFGPAYTFRRERTSAFAHALFGGVHQGVGQGTINGIAPSYTAFLWSVGGGLDVALSKAISVRVAQLDYERHSIPGSFGQPGSSTNGLRYSAGVVLRF